MKYIKIESYDELLKYDGQTVFIRDGNKYTSGIVGCVNHETGSVKMKDHPKGFLYLGSDNEGCNGGHLKIAGIMRTKYAYCVTFKSFNYCDLYIRYENIKVEIGSEFLN